MGERSATHHRNFGKPEQLLIALRTMAERPNFAWG
jgi:hypothetical protein